MEFWGVEVKNGTPLSVAPGEDMIVHISQIALGEKKNNGNEQVKLYLKVGDQKLVIGTLSHDKFPQLGTEIVLEKEFELSHNWKHGSVFFTGYKVDASEPDTDEDMSDEEPAAVARDVRQVNFKLPNEDVKADENDKDSSSEDDSSDDSEDEKEKKVTAEAAIEEDDEDDSSDSAEDDSSEEEDDTPKKAVEDKKRPAEANTSKNSASTKKAKFVTPQKTESSKPHVHVATPHPSKGGKTSASNGEASKQKTPKSGGASFGCKSCNRSFNSEMGLQSHTKAKHSAAA